MGGHLPASHPEDEDGNTCERVIVEKVAVPDVISDPEGVADAGTISDCVERWKAHCRQ
jgi:hypothetical protein